jgi:hypothetical protein
VDLHRAREELGIIGVDSFAALSEDDVRVAARLSAPAYCYLIALNPDGRPQLCYPQDESTPPARVAAVVYPPDPGSGFGLTDGTGLQAFALVASRRPLPPYAEWSARAGALPWGRAEASRGWRYDGRRFEPLETERGVVRPLAGPPSELIAACGALERRVGCDAIRVEAFPVKAKPGPAP